MRAHLLSDCLRVLGAKAVIDTPSDATGTLTWAPYHCGALAQHLLVDLAAAQQPGYDIFQLWESLFAASAKEQYDNAAFLSVARKAELRLSADHVDALQHLMTAPGTEVAALVAKLNGRPQPF